MTEKEYDVRYDELYGKLEDIREKQWDAKCLQKEVHEEEDCKAEEMRLVRRSHDELEDDWNSRGMAGTHAYLFEENERINRTIDTEQSYVWNDDTEMKAYLKELVNEEARCEEEQRDLTRAYETTKKEEKKDGKSSSAV